jgi:hypothetical protein
MPANGRIPIPDKVPTTTTTCCIEKYVSIKKKYGGFLFHV